MDVGLHNTYHPTSVLMVVVRVSLRELFPPQFSSCYCSWRPFWG